MRSHWMYSFWENRTRLGNFIFTTSYSNSQVPSESWSVNRIIGKGISTSIYSPNGAFLCSCDCAQAGSTSPPVGPAHHLFLFVVRCALVRVTKNEDSPTRLLSDDLFVVILLLSPCASLSLISGGPVYRYSGVLHLIFLQYITQVVSPIVKIFFRILRSVVCTIGNDGESRKQRDIHIRQWRGNGGPD